MLRNSTFVNYGSITPATPNPALKKEKTDIQDQQETQPSDDVTLEIGNQLALLIKNHFAKHLDKKIAKKLFSSAPLQTSEVEEKAQQRCVGWLQTILTTHKKQIESLTIIGICNICRRQLLHARAKKFLDSVQAEALAHCEASALNSSNVALKP